MFCYTAQKAWVYNIVKFKGGIRNDGKKKYDYNDDENRIRSLYNV